MNLTLKNHTCIPFLNIQSILIFLINYTDEECNVSGECDISRGLCCQLQRRHRQTPRKVFFMRYFHTQKDHHPPTNLLSSSRQVCSYFKDPLVCIGPVATDQIKSIVQYTSGEKRITGQGNRIFKRSLKAPFA